MSLFKDEHITPKSLAKALNITPEEAIADLTNHKERGVLTQTISENTVLPWGAVRRACERAGLKTEDISKPEAKEPISRGEWDLLKVAATEAAGFHRVYGESVRDFAEKADPAGAKELLEYHLGRAEAIENLVKRLEIKPREPDAPAL